ARSAGGGTRPTPSGRAGRRVRRTRRGRPGPGPATRRRTGCPRRLGGRASVSGAPSRSPSWSSSVQLPPTARFCAGPCQFAGGRTRPVSGPSPDFRQVRVRAGGRRGPVRPGRWRCHTTTAPDGTGDAILAPGPTLVPLVFPARARPRPAVGPAARRPVPRGDPGAGPTDGDELDPGRRIEQGVPPVLHDGI